MESERYPTPLKLRALRAENCTSKYLGNATLNQQPTKRFQCCVIAYLSAVFTQYVKEAQTLYRCIMYLSSAFMYYLDKCFLLFRQVALE
jgi:hypothetical protein